MDLLTEIKQTNDRLLVQNALLQQQISNRIQSPQFGSFLLTFVVTPFIVGAAANLSLGSKGAVTRQLCLAVLPGLRLWPFF